MNLFFIIGILNWIFSNPGSTLKAVTKQLDIPKNTVCVSIDGLVERKQSTEKRREVHLKVTTKGKDVSQRLIKNASSYKAMAKALENLSKKRNIKFSSKLSKN
ncbi:MarR family winged helix-turn-helix transcriptional regulator [Priestia megaterium]|uniref:MarR family winged helix-turn-helix transcriptional regulator n=1 Tax=Priestia megaterium TaxID=1404 RepID=UPI002B249ECC|nr:MarR family winged helix-turn-helix transcriptional regulator [Priestia megaterium]MEB2294449.1 MarR family winged helix-turn-helix transcriptional regulator [Priestia megaterium]